MIIKIYEISSRFKLGVESALITNLTEFRYPQEIFLFYKSHSKHIFLVISLSLPNMHTGIA